MEKEMVTISKEEYDKLKRDSCFLDNLMAAGVDNWDWYDEAVEEFYNSHPEYSD